MNCEICNREVGYRWTDTHGIAACIFCGAPYKIYHYDKDNKRIDKPAQLLFYPHTVSWIKRYWEAHKRNCAPMAFNMSGSRYEVATDEDCEIFESWIKENPCPKSEDKLEN